MEACKILEFLSYVHSKANHIKSKRQGDEHSSYRNPWKFDWHLKPPLPTLRITTAETVTELTFSGQNDTTISLPTMN
ncbi:hypothetical protein Y032_0501g2599 [Ancylostoma ceylanicum]|uniref:Uncharacterized protein n=1 Tax=Ancylostoma ceylanicum TaxID=53326 RepID=A0A016WTM9_9BILA|nr:hypothetical protein Y032_0501g2599 [Ancylostoma ceylanicum]